LLGKPRARVNHVRSPCTGASRIATALNWACTHISVQFERLNFLAIGWVRIHGGKTQALLFQAHN
jgi:hypothetical protein